MGANQSSLIPTGADDQAVDSVSAKLASRHGFQILRVHPNSPVSEAKVFPYFDYIISINGVEVSPDIPNLIGEMARNHVNKPLKLSLYNSRQDEEREVTIVPRTGWGGEGLLGCAIRFSPLEGVRDRVWHILKVHDNSPAHKAGLIADEDFVIASPDLLLRSEDEFYQLITQNTHRQVKLIVFNAKKEELREIVIVPDFEWGGEGCLGCDVGSGMVHWIPKKGANNNISSPVLVQSPQLQVQTQEPLVLQPASPLAPQASLLQSQYQQLLPSQPSSMTDSPAKGPQVPQVNVSIPSARPVVNLSSDLSLHQHQQGVSQAIFPESVPAPALAPPPMTTYHHHPHSHHQQQQNPQAQSPSPVIDDIPMPNFSVPSDIINQK